DAADVLDAEGAAVGGDLEDDVGELAYLGEAAAGAQGDLDFLPPPHRGLADLPGGDLVVLLADRLDHVGGGQVAGGQFFRVEPDAHAVVALAEQEDVADPRHAEQLVADLHQGVVAQVQLRVAAVGLCRGRGRVDGKAHQDVGRALQGGDPGLLD